MHQPGKTGRCTVILTNKSFMSQNILSGKPMRIRKAEEKKLHICSISQIVQCKNSNYRMAQFI